MKKQTKLMTAVLLFVLCFTLVTTAFATNAFSLEKDPIEAKIACYIDQRGVVREWCDSQNNYHKVTYDVYWCEDGSYDWREVGRETIYGMCPYIMDISL